ncbi:MAG: hypothetical protein K8S97_14965 [Anaerolineae bacterium]|nr:hypothetical protein [Anaerolineae bacterium]
MSDPWYSLYLPLDDPAPVIDALRATLDARGYAPYDPFSGGTGTPLKLTATVRHFVAPAQAGWVRVLGQPDNDALLDFHQRVAAPVIVGWLTGEEGGFALLHDGARHESSEAVRQKTLDAFADYLRPEHTLDTLRAAFEGEIAVAAVDSDEPPVAVVGGEALPPELAEFAAQQGVDAGKANKMFERLGGKLLGRFTGGDQDEARAMIMGQAGGDIWNSLHGQRVRAVAGVLRLPATWRTPTWQQVRDAYQIHRLRQRSPRMMLMPGDQEALDAVRDALDYTPVYMGQSG